MVLPCEGHSRPSDIPPSLTQASPWMAEGAARPSRWKARTSHRPIRPARQGRCQASGQEACPQDTGAPKTWGQASRAPETGPRGRGDTGACAESERTQWAAVGGEGDVHGPKPVGAAGRCAGAGQQRRPEEGLWDRCPARKGKAILAAGRGLQGKKSPGQAQVGTGVALPPRHTGSGGTRPRGAAPSHLGKPQSASREQTPAQQQIRRAPHKPRPHITDGQS